MNRTGNPGAKPGTRRPTTDLSTCPANLTLEQYRLVSPFVVANLVREFGEAAALRLLNGKPKPEPAVVPFDPALLAPPGAATVPRAHRTRGNGHLIAESS